MKFTDKDGKSLLVSGRFNNDTHAHNNPDYAYKEFSLEYGERLIGMVSRAEYDSCARIKDCQFLIGKLI